MESWKASQIARYQRERCYRIHRNLLKEKKTRSILVNVGQKRKNEQPAQKKKSKKR